MDEDPNSLDFWAIVGVVTLRQQLPNWMPVVDGLYLPEDEAFMPKHPKVMWREGAASNKDIITGHTHHDSSGFITGSLIGLPSNDTSELPWLPLCGARDFDFLHHFFQPFVNISQFGLSTSTVEI